MKHPTLLVNGCSATKTLLLRPWSPSQGINICFSPTPINASVSKAVFDCLLCLSIRNPALHSPRPSWVSLSPVLLHVQSAWLPWGRSRPWAAFFFLFYMTNHLFCLFLIYMNVDEVRGQHSACYTSVVSKFVIILRSKASPDHVRCWVTPLYPTTIFAEPKFLVTGNKSQF